jgi:glycosyltransferase involved in cell wall biosynthesis
MTEPLKLAVIAGIFHPEPGGPATYLYHLLPELITQGYAVRVLTYGEADMPAAYPYPVQRISRQTSIAARLLAYSRAAWQLVGWADVLFIQGYGLPVLPAWLWYRRPLVVKIVSDFAWEFARRHQWIDDTVDVHTFQQMALPLRVRLVRWQQTLVARLARAVIVPSTHVERLVAGWGIPARKIHIISNAAPPEADLPPTQAAAREALAAMIAEKSPSVDSDQPILLSVGRLTAVKGVDVAVRALADIPNARLVVIGDGEDRAMLTALAAESGVGDRVIFLGNREHRDVMVAMRACDVFVLSSYTEGLSHVLLEALSEQKAVVATAVGGNLEIVTDGENGLLIPAGDSSALADAVRRVLTDSDLAQQLSVGAGVRSRDFSWETLVRRTVALLQK